MEAQSVRRRKKKHQKTKNHLSFTYIQTKHLTLKKKNHHLLTSKMSHSTTIACKNSNGQRMLLRIYANCIKRKKNKSTIKTTSVTVLKNLHPRPFCGLVSSLQLLTSLERIKDYQNMSKDAV